MLGVIALTGCARDNPLFGDGAGGSDGDTGGTSAVTTGDRPGEETSRPGEGSAEGSAGDDTPGVTTGAETGPVDPTDPATSGETGIGSEETGIGPKMCNVGFDTPFDLYFDGEQPDCLLTVEQFVVVDVLPTGFWGVQCDGCCEGGFPPVGDEVEIDLGLDIDLLPWPIEGCVTLAMQRYQVDVANCELEAYNLTHPVYGSLVVSNVVDPSIAEPFNFHLGAPDPADCVTECGELAGYRSLAADNGVTPLVPPDGAATVVDDPNNPTITWDLYNFGSGVDGLCGEHGRWIGVSDTGVDPDPVDPPKTDEGVEPPDPDPGFP